MYGVKVTGAGSFHPDKVVTNEEISEILLARLDKYVTTGVLPKEGVKTEQFKSDPQWILDRTGVRERRHAAEHQATSDLAVESAKNALQMSGLRRDLIEFIIVATVTPDHLASPPTAALVQRKLDIQSKPAVFDVGAACSSFVSALFFGYSLIRSGAYKRGLVIGADTMSRIANWNDRKTLPLFGDGAGCFVLERTVLPEDQFGLNNFSFGSDGSFADLIQVPAGGSRKPIEIQTLSNPFDQGHTLQMSGLKVYKEIVRLVSEIVIPQALAKAGLRLEDIDAMILHQANKRIEEEIIERLGYRGIVYGNIGRFGNTTSAATPTCFVEAVDLGIIKAGMIVLFAAFGGGLTWATALMRNGLGGDVCGQL
ncbi:MAG TPA: beta-ketoacyl-ACP synthase 3 [Candidatus Paceibacterota bacterium]